MLIPSAGFLYEMFCQRFQSSFSFFSLNNTPDCPMCCSAQKMKPYLTTAVSVAELMMGRYFCYFWRQIQFMVIKNQPRPQATPPRRVLFGGEWPGDEAKWRLTRVTSNHLGELHAACGTHAACLADSRTTLFWSLLVPGLRLVCPAR